MIVYFADRQLNILGQASTGLPQGLIVTGDKKSEDVETGVAVFECEIHFTKETRLKVEEYAEVGNYLLRSHNNENELYTIIDAEIDTRKQTVYIYAEDDGLDLLNEVVGAYEADKAYSIEHYIKMYAATAGFVIGINEVKNLTRKLSWDGEATKTARIASIATQFDGCEVSYSYDINGLSVVRRKINIYKQRGKDAGATLYLNRDIDSIITTKSIANIATAFQCTGGTIEQDSTVLEATSSGTPKIAYEVELETASRTASTAKITATIKAALTSEDAELGEDYGLKASLYIGGSWHSVTIKPTDKKNKQAWTGTGNHLTDFTFTVSGVSAGVTTFSDIKFKVERSDNKGGSAGILASTNCKKWIVPNYINGGENGEEINSRPITLEGFKYDDGDFYVDGSVVKSRKALKRWRRYLWKTEDAQQEGGHIVKLYTFDTGNQETLCQRAITELKKIIDMEINYEVDIRRLPDNVKIGDRVNIVDDAGEMYISTRLLQLKTSVCDEEYTAVLGEHLIKTSGISQKVIELAAQFAKTSQSATRALAIANNAKSVAATAKSEAATAAIGAGNAQLKAEEAQEAATTAQASAEAAQLAADAAEQKVTTVEQSVASLEKTIDEAQIAAEQAQQAAGVAQGKAEEAKEAAEKAETDAEEAKTASTEAQGKADNAITNANEAKEAANTAKTEATAAKDTADAAKLDAKQAINDINSLGDRLNTVVDTMEADYTRKTELTETTAHLQSQISKNAAGITENYSMLTVIDETANDAQKQLQGALAWVEIAQAKADKAQEDAEAALAAADTAAQAAEDAQSEADIAQAAADTARGVADKAAADLAAAKVDLETVSSRVDATEEEIAAAQAAVNAAQAAADTAKANAKTAIQQAAGAQEVAAQAVANAEYAQSVADNAAAQAFVSKLAADEAKGNAAAAQAAADEAAAAAEEAQGIANAAVENAENAKVTAYIAAQVAADAQTAANEADAKVEKAAADLAAAQRNLTDVTSRVDATEEEVAEAQAAVETAQAAADAAQAEATAAQVAADNARTEYYTAQSAANNAQAAADEATAAAEEAQRAAAVAQVAVNGLAKRIINSETEIVKNANEIALKASKSEVAKTLAGYYTKSEANAALTVKADAITSAVSETYATQETTTSLATLVQQLKDNILNLVVDSTGQSAMTKLDNGSWTFSTANLEQTVSDIQGILSSLNDTVGGYDSAIGILQGAVKDLGVVTSFVKIGEYVYTDANGEIQQEPSIDLYETDTDSRLRITNNRFIFSNGTEAAVEIDSMSKTLKAQKVAAQEAEIGGSWVWKKRANGNLGLVWKEGAN